MVNRRKVGIVLQGVRIYDNQVLNQKTIDALEGQRFQEWIEPEWVAAGPNQLAFLHGVLCVEPLQSNVYAGWEKEELLNHYLDLFASDFTIKEKTLPDGKRKEIVIRKKERISKMGKKRLSEFIEKIIVHLVQEGIEISDTNDYLLKKYHQNSHE